MQGEKGLFWGYTRILDHWNFLGPGFSLIGLMNLTIWPYEYLPLLLKMSTSQAYKPFLVEK